MVLYASFDEFLSKFIERASTPSPLPPNPGRGNGLENLGYTAVALYENEFSYDGPVKVYDINNRQLRFNHHNEGQYESEFIFSPIENATRIKYQISYGPITVDTNAVSTACLKSFYKKPTSHGYLYAIDNLHLYGYRDTNHLLCLPQEVLYLKRRGPRTVCLTPQGTSVLYTLRELETVQPYIANGTYSYKSYRLPIHHF